MKILRFLTLSTGIIFSFALSAQLLVDNTPTPDDLVPILIGDGVSFSNVTYEGDLNQFGSFMSNGSNIGIGEGVIMGNGDVNFAPGPNNTGSGSLGGGNFGANDIDLDAVSGVNTNDKAVIEFDFVPTGDTIKFKYVFGSEEYDDFECCTVNDAFGFFISGPGIVGPFSSPPGFPDGSINIATIPGSDIGVSINTVNSGNANCAVTNCTNLDPNFLDNVIYFTSNTGGATVQYDGFTVVLTAFAFVECGETYHIKLAIADGGDTVWDSAVFLESGSFSASAEQLVVETLFPEGLVEISALCDTGFATINRNCDADSLFYHLNFSGTATYGVDYTAAVTDFVMVPGQSEYSFGLNAIPDGVIEGTEVIEIQVSVSSDSITYAVKDTAYVNVLDTYTFPVITSDIDIYCPQDSVLISALPQSQVAIIDFLWLLDGDSISDQWSEIVPLPGTSATYEVFATDFCGANNAPASVTINNLIPPAPTAVVSNDGTPYCPGIADTLIADVLDGLAPYNYVWSTGESGTTIGVTPGSTVTYTVTVTDDCGRQDDATIEVVYPEPLVVDGNFSDILCTDQVLDLVATSTGGTGGNQFFWVQVNENGSPIPPSSELTFNATDGTGEVDPLESGIYYFKVCVIDECPSNCFNIFSPNTDIDTVEVLSCEVPNVFTPNGDGQNDFLEITELLNRDATLFIYNRWGKVVYEKRNYRNNWSGGDLSEGTYYYAVLFNDGPDTIHGYFTILR